MTNTTGFLFVGLLSVGSLFALGACGDDETTTTTTTSSTAGSGGDASSSTTGGMGGSGGAGGGNADVCETYCIDIMANCIGENAQYTNTETCVETCKALPQDGMASATTGNSIQCRTYHAGSPAKMDPAMHCTHAGPGGAGACGMDCEGFCAIAIGTCNTQWPTMAACMDMATGCPAFKDDMMKYDAKDTAGDTFDCRLYHLTVATTDAATHCAHTVFATKTGEPCFGM